MVQPRPRVDHGLAAGEHVAPQSGGSPATGHTLEGADPMHTPRIRVFALTTRQSRVRAGTRGFTRAQHSRGKLWTVPFAGKRQTPLKGSPKPLLEAPAPSGASPL